MSIDHVDKANKHMERGEKCLKKWGFWSSSKHEDAAEAFQSGGGCFKVSKEWANAARAYEKAAEHFMLSKLGRDACMSYKEAAKSWDKAGALKESIESYEKAISMYVEDSKYVEAARLLQEVGDIHKKNDDIRAAVDALEVAAGYFESGSNSSSSANKCLLMIATMITQNTANPEFGRAAEIFEKLGKSSLEKNLLRMNAKAYWLQAGLCLLAVGDATGARQKYDQFVCDDPNFEDSRQWRFLGDLIRASDELDLASFSTICFEYDKITKLDPWQTQVCLKIKRHIETEAGPGSDEEDDVDLT